MTAVRAGWLAVACALSGACQGDDEPRDDGCIPKSGVVLRVLDGDTIEIRPEEGGAVKVRYLLADTPELTGDLGPECFAEEARTLNEQLVLGETVTLAYDDGQCVDRFERALAYVSTGGRMVNRTLIERGYARVLVIRDGRDSPYVHEAEFLQLEALAQTAGSGLWGACP